MGKFFSKIYGLILFIVFGGLVCLAYYLMVDTKERFGIIESSTIGINVILFLIVLGIFIYSWCCFKRLKNSMIDLNNLKDDRDLQDFENEEIKKAYYKYKNESYELQNNYYTTNIGDYINKELLDSISDKNLLNIVPSVMIGLGILGTFVGLSFGLQDFKLVIDANIEKNVQQLLDGIKIAFHTSIYGMVFSLSFNWILKGVFGEAYSVLDEFFSTFENSERKNEKSIFVAIEKLSKDIVDNLSKNLVSEMKDVSKSLTGQFDNLNETMKHGIGVNDETISSMSNKLNEALSGTLTYQLDRINATLRNLSENILDKQMESLDRIVDKFVDRMHKSLGHNFKELGDKIESILSDQNIMADRINVILDRFQTATDTINSINDNFDRSSEKFKDYIEDLDILQRKVSDNISAMIEQIKDINKSNNDIQKQIVSLTESAEKYGEKISNASEDFTSKISQNVEYIKDVQMALNRQIEYIDRNFNIYVENTKTLSEDLKCNSVASLKLLSDTSKAEIIEVTNQQIEILSEVKIEVKNLLEDIENRTQIYITQTQENTQDYINQAKATAEIITKENEKFLNHFSEETNKLWSLSAESFKKVQDKSIENFDKIQNGFKSIIKKFEETAEKVKKTTEELPDELENNLVDALNETFSKCTISFREMNGTITDLNGKLDVLANSRLKGLDSGFEDINSKLDGLNSKLIVFGNYILKIEKLIPKIKTSVVETSKTANSLVNSQRTIMPNQQGIKQIPSTPTRIQTNTQNRIPANNSNNIMGLRNTDYNK